MQTGQGNTDMTPDSLGSEQQLIYAPLYIF